MSTLLPEKLSAPDPSNPTDAQSTLLPEKLSTVVGNIVFPMSTSAEPVYSWSVIDVDPVARAQWLNYLDIFGDQ